MGVAGDHRRRRHRTAALGAGLAVAVALSVAGGRDPTPPPPLPPRPAGRPDIELVVAAEHDGAGLRIDVEVTVAPAGDVLTVTSWDCGTVVAERLPEGQVVVHVGLVEPGPPEPRDEVFTMTPLRPPPPAMVMPGRTVEETLRVDGPGPRVSGIEPAGDDDRRRIDEVRVCLWSERERDRDDRPAVCADDRL